MVASQTIKYIINYVISYIGETHGSFDSLNDVTGLRIGV